MITPTQQELEQPVKGYQLLEVSNKMSDMNKKLDTLIAQTSNLVTFSDLDKAVTERKECVRDTTKTINVKIDNEVEKINTRIDNEVDDIRRSSNKIFWIMIAVVVSVVAEIIAKNILKL